MDVGVLFIVGVSEGALGLELVIVRHTCSK